MSAVTIWVLGGVLCALTELAVPFILLIFFAFGAWAAAATAWLGYGLDWQFGTFITVSVLSIVFLRKHARLFFSGRAKSGDDAGAHPMTGRSGVVSKSITPFEPGEVNIGGSFWRARAERHINPGEQVRVHSVLPDDALTLKVEPLRPNEKV